MSILSENARLFKFFNEITVKMWKIKFVTINDTNRQQKWNAPTNVNVNTNVHLYIFIFIRFNAKGLYDVKTDWQKESTANNMQYMVRKNLTKTVRTTQNCFSENEGNNTIHSQRHTGIVCDVSWRDSLKAGNSRQTCSSS